MSRFRMLGDADRPLTSLPMTQIAVEVIAKLTADRVTPPARSGRR
jgi:hypothetical protein